jgi:hypothetical protein
VPTSRSNMVQFRAKTQELKRWRGVAKDSDMSLSEWIRTTLNLHSTPAPPRTSPVVSGPQPPLPKVK